MLRKRCSATEWSGSEIVTSSGSPNTVDPRRSPRRACGGSLGASSHPIRTPRTVTYPVRLPNDPVPTVVLWLASICTGLIVQSGGTPHNARAAICRHRHRLATVRPPGSLRARSGAEPNRSRPGHCLVEMAVDGFPHIAAHLVDAVPLGMDAPAKCAGRLSTTRLVLTHFEDDLGLGHAHSFGAPVSDTASPTSHAILGNSIISPASRVT